MVKFYTLLISTAFVLTLTGCNSSSSNEQDRFPPANDISETAIVYFECTQPSPGNLKACKAYVDDIEITGIGSVNGVARVIYIELPIGQYVIRTEYRFIHIGAITDYIEKVKLITVSGGEEFYFDF